LETNRERIQSREEEASPEGWVKCPFCPCWFVCEEDFEIHMKAFGRDKENHFVKYLRKHNLPFDYYSREQRESWEKRYREK